MNLFARALIRLPVAHLAAVLFLTETVRSALMFSFVPAYAVHEAGITVTAVGVAVSVHFAADTAMKAVSGCWLGRAAPHTIVQIAYGCGMLGLIAIYFSHQPALLIAGSALLGIGASPIWLLCMSAVKEEERATQMGWIYTVWLCSLGFGPVAVNFMLGRGFGLSFLFLACLWFAGWLAALRWDPAPLLSGPMQQRPLRKQLRRLLWQMRRIRPLLPGMVLQTAAAGLLVPILPHFAENVLRLTYAEYSLMLIAGGVGTAAFLVPMGRWADGRGYKRFLVAGFGALAALLCLLLHSPNHIATFTLVVMLGIAYAALLPAWNALLAHFVPQDQKAMGWGLLSGVEAIGIMIGPAAGGWIAGRFDETATIFFSSLLLLGLALFYLFYRKPLRS
ncbi:MFS transporter [Paenibacillus cymbidii]|uniref:MFS transporter n=1 Tax=Paenibacillus cymbidii TaxID=1639034 RepID=UPI0010807232|nr:MFS transporter [Paenibacillus cymbidii]